MGGWMGGWVLDLTTPNHILLRPEVAKITGSRGAKRPTVTTFWGSPRRPSEIAPGTFLNTPFFENQNFGSRPKNSRSTRRDLPGIALDISGDELSIFSIDLQFLQVDESLIESDGA